MAVHSGTTLEGCFYSGACRSFLRRLERSHFRTRQKLGWFSRLRELLKSVGDLQQHGLAPGASEKCKADWQAKDESRRHSDIGISGYSGSIRAASAGVVAVDPVGYSGRTGGGR